MAREEFLESTDRHRTREHLVRWSRLRLVLRYDSSAGVSLTHPGNCEIDSSDLEVGDGFSKD